MDENEPTGEAVGTGNDERIARLNAIADSTDVERADEFAHVNDDGTTEPFSLDLSPAEPISDNQESSGAESDPDADQVAAVVDDSSKRYKLKINGREVEFTEAELIARASKIEAADDYLRQASDIKRKAQTLAEPEPNQEVLQRQRDDEDLALVRAIQVGTEQEALAALRKLREQAGARPSLSRDDVSRTIDERLAFNTAIDRFSTEYNDVWSDPILKKIAFDKDAQLLQQGDTRPYWERYQEIGNEVRSWKESLAPVKKAEVTMTDKEARKASAPKVPTPASAKSRPAKVEEDDIDDNPSAIISAMAQRRGGPQWMRS